LRAGETWVLDLTGPNGVSRAISELGLLKRKALSYCQQHFRTATRRNPPAKLALNVALRHLRALPQFNQLRRALRMG
jgi:hypothetical protein